LRFIADRKLSNIKREMSSPPDSKAEEPKRETIVSTSPLYASTDSQPGLQNEEKARLQLVKVHASAHYLPLTHARGYMTYNGRPEDINQTSLAADSANISTANEEMRESTRSEENHQELPSTPLKSRGNGVSASSRPVTPYQSSSPPDARWPELDPQGIYNFSSPQNSSPVTISRDR
jgi:hypothetical protein